MMKQIVAAAVALSLGTTPALAQRTATVASVEPAGETLSGSEQFGEGNSLVAPVIAGLIVVFGILLATETWPFDDDDDPVSP